MVGRGWGGDSALHHVEWYKEGTTTFSKLNKICVGYFDPESTFVGNEHKHFSG